MNYMAIVACGHKAVYNRQHRIGWPVAELNLRYRFLLLWLRHLRLGPPPTLLMSRRA
jgi:hypothetical protein